MRRYADCGHEFDGPTDTGYCRRCEAILRDEQEQQAVEDEARRQQEESPT